MAAYISFQPKDDYNTTKYTGTGASNAQTGIGFQPDFTWIKNRDTDGDFYVMTDAGRGATKYLQCDDTDVEATNAESLKSFDSDGFTVGTMNEVNTNTENYISWNWKAATTSGIAGSPSITPTSYSFNATSGFSIIKYTGNGTSGATIPHGLGVAPDMVITKNLDVAEGWPVYHTSLGATQFMKLNVNTAVGTGTGYWNDTAPSATLVTLGNDGGVNQDTKNMVAYCFANKKGYSKFGSFRGNGDNDGTFIYTGFRPAFVMIKSVNLNNWIVWDNKRDFNRKNYNLFLSNDFNEDEKANMLLSNGFKCGVSDGDTNENGAQLVYAAFAESPIVSSNNVPGLAR